MLGKWVGFQRAAVLAGVLLFAGVTRPAAAETATVGPSADAFLFAGEAAQNYGGAGVLATSDPARAQGEYQSVMRFDLAAAKTSFDTVYGAGNWTLQSASLRLTTSSPNNAIFNANAAGPIRVGWMKNDTWVEGTGSPTAPTTDGITFGTLPNYLSAQDESLGVINFGGGSGTNTYALSISQGFAGDVTSGSLLSLRLFTSPGDSASYLYSSRNFQNAAGRPLLTLIAVPEPTMAGAGFAVAAIMAARSRRA